MDDGVGALAGMRAAVLASLEDSAGTVETVGTICRACVEVLPVDGASVSVIAGTDHRETVYATDEVIGEVESLQFTLGEGPCFEAFHGHRPVLVPDLAAAMPTSWPVFATEAAALPIGALYAFPIQSGAISIGALDFYRRETGWLSEDEVTTALQVVDLTAMILLAAQTLGPDGDATGMRAWATSLPSGRGEVHQATGMLIAALGVPANQALARLRGHAFATGRSVEQVAGDVVARTLDPNDLQR